MTDFKETAELISLHGLGFLQVKLPGNQRIHVWHPELPKRKCFKHSSVHDHRFGFTSRVLIGEQMNQYYRAVGHSSVLDHTHIAYLHEGERTVYGNRPWMVDHTLLLEKVGPVEFINPGDEYHMSPYIYHSTETNGVCVTLMTKEHTGLSGAHSLCEIDIEPDVDFDRKQWSNGRLWEIFHDAFSQ